MVSGTGAVAIVPGLREFSIPYRMFLEFVPDFIRDGVPFRADNLECDKEAPACKMLAGTGPLTMEVNGVAVGVISLVGPHVAAAVHPDNVKQLTFKDPVVVANELAVSLRKVSRVDLVVAVVNLEESPGSVTRTMEFFREVRGIDVIIAGGAVAEQKDLPVFASATAGEGSTLLVASPRAPHFLGRVALKLERKGKRYRVVAATPHMDRVGAFSRNPEAAEVLSQALAEFCSLAGRVLGTGRVYPPMNWNSFVEYVMEIVRRQMRADLAILSADSVQLVRTASVKGPMTVGLMSHAFAKHEMVRLSVLGQDLSTFLLGYQSGAAEPPLAGNLFLAGATVLADAAVYINERPLNLKRRYTIATTDFLASGGKSYLKALLASPYTRREASGYFLQELVQRFFSRDLDGPPDGSTEINVKRDFSSLWERPLWEVNMGLNGSVTNVTIDNPGNYSETQLISRSPHTGFKGDGTLQLTVSTRDHKVSDYFNVQYGMVQVGEGPYDETKDLVTEELTYAWTRLRNVQGKGRVWVPAPLAKGKLETEFSGAPAILVTDDDGTPVLDPDTGVELREYEPFHHLELTALAGFEWLFGTKASAGLGYGVRVEALATEGSGRQGPQAGIELYYQINALPLFMWKAGSSVTLDSRFELFYSDWADDDTLKGVGSTRLTAAVLGPLSFTLGFDLFLFRTGSSGLAYSFDTMAGLSVTYDAALQQF